MKRLSQKLLDEIVRRLVAELHPQAIILFGSHAWGRPHRDSDVDLFVVMPRKAANPVKVAQRGHLALHGLEISKDILISDRREVERFRHVYVSFIAEVIERGRLLYGSLS